MPALRTLVLRNPFSNRLETGGRSQIPLECDLEVPGISLHRMDLRSDALHRLTDRDHDRLAELNLRLVCDLRYGEERAREPSRLPVCCVVERNS